MIPSQPVDTKSPAEVKAFHAFEEALGDGWVVAHSVRWLFKTTRGGPRPPEEREADFFISHPDFGALVMEVKGGEVRHDASSGRWTSTSRGGRVNEIKDPARQAQQAVHSLRQFISELPDLDPVGPIGYAIAFPDGVADEALLPNMPEALVFDAAGFIEPEELARRVEGAAKYWGGKGRGKWTRASLNKLIDRVSHDIEIKAHLSLALDEADKEILHLSESQFRVLDQVASNPRIAVAGCAGSGKTLLAAELATRLAASGFHTLLTCFNRPLADHLKVRISAPDLDVMNFHQVCYEMTKRAGIKVPQPSASRAKSRADEEKPSRDESEERVRRALRGESDEEDYWEQLMPDGLAQAAEKLGPQYDAIVADEGQDFAETWWLALPLLLEDPDEGRIYVFYDDNQAVYPRPRGLPDGMFQVQLTENWRNTKQIHEYMDPYYRGVEVRAVGPDGPRVETHAAQWDEIPQAVQATLERLVNEGIKPRDIVILVPSLEGSPLPPKLGNYRITESPKGRNDVRLETVRRFKGLDSKVVIVAGARPQDSREVMYVACSRARTHLTVIERLTQKEAQTG